MKITGVNIYDKVNDVMIFVEIYANTFPDLCKQMSQYFYDDYDLSLLEIKDIFVDGKQLTLKEYMNFHYYNFNTDKFDSVKFL